MPMPDWWRHLNKQIFNPLTLRKEHNWALITHHGRKSGKSYTTPVEAIPVAGGYVVFLMYGRNTDWAKNLLAAGSGVILCDRKPYSISEPRIVQLADISNELPPDLKHPPSVLRVKELIRFDTDEN